MSSAGVTKQTESLDTQEVKFLLNRLAFHIADYKKKRDWSRRYAGLIKGLLIALSGSTTILLGIKEYAFLFEYKEAIGMIALVLSASGSMLVAIESVTNNTWRWIKYRRTLYALYSIQDDLGYAQASASPVPQDTIEGLYKRMCATLDAYNDEWLKERARSLTEFTGGAGPATR
jgi:hypothetical protein